MRPYSAKLCNVATCSSLPWISATMARAFAASLPAARVPLLLPLPLLLSILTFDLPRSIGCDQQGRAIRRPVRRHPTASDDRRLTIRCCLYPILLRLTPLCRRTLPWLRWLPCSAAGFAHPGFNAICLPLLGWLPALLSMCSPTSGSVATSGFPHHGRQAVPVRRTNPPPPPPAAHQSL